MENVIIKTSETVKDLHGILALQKANLLQNLIPEELDKEGFVRVHHRLEDLQKLQEQVPHIIAIQNGEVIAYVLTMTAASREEIPMLIPMFRQFDRLIFRGKKISSYSYLVVGQVCIAKAHRGKRLFTQIYQAYRTEYSGRFDFAITEISLKNPRSLKAHLNIGFQIIHQFKDEFEDWAIVLWDWNQTPNNPGSQSVI
ncbi:GNAT family N-acetyltransferase [Algoriphagus hitonicola]|uniref:Acetyltransferase (GNAT) family protein n=1 Tax=Algoriphagus hitonicola TaxID=435880 RepID=A0A1I2WD39_9BACT|nr:GNAT family N-acetyltransferase [Algoriphagus hitonicola]SFG99263.1 hypothetical protein SAMN04487988_11278 [Algoriphagus hitonicola]